MLIRHKGKAPRIHDTARIAPNAIICGDVTIGANTSVGFGAVLNAESGPVSVGEDSIIMENAVLRGVKSAPLHIGDRCLIGPHAHLSGCRIGDESFIATGVAIFNGAEIGARSTVRVNAVVQIDTTLAEGASVPIGWVAIGAPPKILPPDQADEILAQFRKTPFSQTVFGRPPPAPGRTPLGDAAPQYAQALKSHLTDEIIS